jgi:hypothetical protein
MIRDNRRMETSRHEAVGMHQWTYAQKRPTSFSFTAPASLLTGPIHFRMNHPHVPGQRIIAREGLLLRAQMTSDLLLTGVVDRVLVPRKIVGSRKDRIARFSSRRIDPLTFMGASLGVPRRVIAANEMTARGRLPVSLSLVLLELRRCLKA